jgi:hypothetical protein
MTPARHRELRASLEERLEKQFPRATASPADRVRWLSEQLENYVERWLGFAVLPGATLRSLLAGDLFGSVEVGSSALDQEIRALPEAARARGQWIPLRTALENIRRSTTLPAPESLRTLLRDFLRA